MVKERKDRQSTLRMKSQMQTEQREEDGRKLYEGKND